MSDQAWATLAGILMIVALRVVDYLLPKGRHLKVVERFSVEDHEHEEDEVDE